VFRVHKVHEVLMMHGGPQFILAAITLTFSHHARPRACAEELAPGSTPNTQCVFVPASINPKSRQTRARCRAAL
jgi:hypothetical protein